MAMTIKVSINQLRDLCDKTNSLIGIYKDVSKDLLDVLDELNNVVDDPFLQANTAHSQKAIYDSNDTLKHMQHLAYDILEMIEQFELAQSSCGSFSGNAF